MINIYAFVYVNFRWFNDVEIIIQVHVLNQVIKVIKKDRPTRN